MVQLNDSRVVNDNGNDNGNNNGGESSSPTNSTGLLSKILREYDVCLGGSSFGKGFQKAARYYVKSHLADRLQGMACLQEPGAALLHPEVLTQSSAEDSFYVVDVGVVISQYYQWRLYFPRVECFYAVKCNPDPVIVRTLAALGSNFDCASRNEIRLVKELTQDFPPDRRPEILYANPCKARLHLIEAVCQGVKMVTFDNVAEVTKCAAVSTSIQLLLRIVTDDRGSQCRLSSKYGAPRNRWRPLLRAAKNSGMQVVGVSFHVGSGCRDASRYGLALQDSKELFEIAEQEFGFHMTILDIGGGFPGETHSTWNPSTELPTIDNNNNDDDDDSNEGFMKEEDTKEDEENYYMFFTEIATKVAPMVDEMFPEESGVRIIAEPGRYFVAAAATLVASVVATRNNAFDIDAVPIDDRASSKNVDEMTRDDEHEMVQKRGRSFSIDEGPKNSASTMLESIADELTDYSKLLARQHLTQQEADVYNDNIDLYTEGYETAIDLLGAPTNDQIKGAVHSVEGMNAGIVNDCGAAATNHDHNNNKDGDVFRLRAESVAESSTAGILTLAAAGEAAVNGMLLQAVADNSSAAIQDDYAYYVNDGVYGAFNNLMYDHAMVRPRHLRLDDGKDNTSMAEEVRVTASRQDGLIHLDEETHPSMQDDAVVTRKVDHNLYASTVFGPTCDSIDVISRSVLLPELRIGDWMYFQNMGAYTMAAASGFNGFTPTERFYVCSVPPKFFEKMVVGPSLLSLAERQEMMVGVVSSSASSPLVTVEKHQKKMVRHSDTDAEEKKE